MTHSEEAAAYRDGMGQFGSEYRGVLRQELEEIIRDNKSITLRFADGNEIFGDVIGADAFCVKVRHSVTEGSGDRIKVTGKVTLAMLDQVTAIMRSV